MRYFVFVFLLLIAYGVTAVNSCVSISSQQVCNDAIHCIWNGTFCLPAAPECTNPATCLQDADCCPGSICTENGVGISASNKTLFVGRSLVEKQCTDANWTCPSPDGIKTLPAAGGHFQLSTFGDLCTLTRIQRNELGNVTAVVPLARSYHYYDWEVAAGSIASEVFRETGPIECRNAVCSFYLPSVAKNQEYQLSSYQYTLSAAEEAARFLQMTTFGTRRSDIQSIQEFPSRALWVQEQMQIPLSSHREYWRKRANPRWTFSQRAGRSDGPCDANSRWRRFTFTDKDAHQQDGFASGYVYVQNTTFAKNETDGRDIPTGPWILLVDGHARTVVQEFAWDEPRIQDLFPHWDPNHPYKICQLPFDYVRGRLYLQTKPYDGKERGTCETIDRDIGNPAINFTGFESYLGDHVIHAPENATMSVIDEWKDGGKTRNDDRYILTSGLNDDLCRNFPSQAEDFDPPIFLRHPTFGLLQWDPRLVLEQNTVDSPMLDGGGSISNATNGATVCANVPRTFENSGQCVLSMDDNTCGSVPPPDTFIDLDAANLVQLHALTGRYVYAIRGLKVKQEEFSYEIDHPCTPGVRSRWERNAGRTCANQTGVSPGTATVLKRLILSSTDRNLYVRDIDFPSFGVECDDIDVELEIEIQVGPDCWTHVHPDHLSIFDMTSWAQEHPGNVDAEAREPASNHPIKKWLDEGSPFLVYPSTHPLDGSIDHTMTRWDSTRQKFDYIGRFGDSINYLDLTDELRVDNVAEYYGVSGSRGGRGRVVCGSPGEVANNAENGSQFDLSSNYLRDTTFRNQYGRSREIVWTMLAMNAPDQLRQRMAFALSQILVIALDSVKVEGKSTEMFLQFYDLFVRNAVGDYLDILRGISYNALMAENLSFLQSKSQAYVYDKSLKREFADENFAREIMQLFTTGLVLLNLDGTPKLDANNSTQKVYTNDEIRSLARAWTGFDRQNLRGNTEQPDRVNGIDPMKIIPEWRDRFPKSDLYGGFIGDGYPLCVDLPERQFLRKGAKYRLLGSSPLPELMTDDALFSKRFTLNQTSSLFSVLCDDRGEGCSFPVQVTLNENLICDNEECDVDTVRVVQMSQDIFYEYVRPACVEMAFYNDAMKLNREYQARSPMCGNPLLPIATSACCESGRNSSNAVSDIRYDIERMTFATQNARCEARGLQSCEYRRVDADAPFWKNDVVFHWAFAPCSIQAKVNPDGLVAIVHNVTFISERKVLHVNDDTQNYFKVQWENGQFPKQEESDCGDCATVEGVNCLCDAFVEDTAVFTSQPNSSESILLSLHVGAPDPSTFDPGAYTTTVVNDFKVHNPADNYTTDTIFEVLDPVGRIRFLKNAKSTVVIGSGVQGSTFSFRNPVHFMSLVLSETNIRDAMYETEATLQHYFYHDNTAPFLCVRFIQRFGMSNPSPRFVKSCATAFRTGTYKAGEVTFGTGRYGDLASTVAAIVLDREAAMPILDADPSHGSIREPILRVIAFMRGMDFRMKDSGAKGETPMIIFHDIDTFIGQMAYEFESVFSFFLPEFAPDGRVSSASLVAPEAQMLDAPKNLATIDGLFALIKYGLSECYRENDVQFGFGYTSVPEVGSGECADNGQYNRATGILTFTPTGATTSDIIDELATVLTSGRLHSSSRQLLMNAYDEALQATNAEAALRLVQQLIVTTPEFQTTNTVKPTGKSRQSEESHSNGGSSYKAIVYLMLSGGCDSFNMLVPRGCTAATGDDAYTHYVNARNPAHLLHEELLPINGSGQVGCETFGVHEKLPIVQDLYNQEELLFFANAGVLGRPSTRENYKANNPTDLFSHNSMQREVRSVDLFQQAAGIGVLGRLSDALTRKGLSAGLISIDTTSSALSGEPGVSPSHTVVSQYGVKRFIPQESISMTKPKMVDTIKALNSAASYDSGFMAETWSNSLLDSLDKNQDLYDTVESTDLETDFGETPLGRKLQMVSKMIKTRESRGTDVDIFYVEIGGFDSHADLKTSLETRFREVNTGLRAFVQEMKLLGMWNHTTLVQISEFARTLSQNSGFGTDHGWGGNYFMAGGAVKGGRILGEYPSDMSDTSTLSVGRGRLIPTTAWDQIWPSIAQWSGVTESSDLDKICPNRGNFPFSFSASDLYRDSPAATETPPPAGSPSNNATEPSAPGEGENSTTSTEPSTNPTVSPGTAIPSQAVLPTLAPSTVMPSQEVTPGGTEESLKPSTQPTIETASPSPGVENSVAQGTTLAEPKRPLFGSRDDSSAWSFRLRGLPSTLFLACSAVALLMV